MRAVVELVEPGDTGSPPSPLVFDACCRPLSRRSRRPQGADELDRQGQRVGLVCQSGRTLARVSGRRRTSPVHRVRLSPGPNRRTFLGPTARPSTTLGRRIDGVRLPRVGPRVSVACAGSGRTRDRQCWASLRIIPCAGGTADATQAIGADVERRCRFRVADGEVKRLDRASRSVQADDSRSRVNTRLAGRSPLRRHPTV